jgi:hypothetical protein
VAIYSAINWRITGAPNANGGGNPIPELINYARAACGRVLGEIFLQDINLGLHSLMHGLSYFIYLVH